MNETLTAIGLCLLGYLSGSLVFALWITRLVKGVDVRDAGSFHATTTNTIRQAGWLPGAAVFILDISKGYLPTLLAVKYAPYSWVIPVTAGLTVVGHCWPLFGQFRGGMGLATAGGSIYAVYPGGFWVGIAIVIALSLSIKHSARAALFTGILLAPTFYMLGERGIVIWLAAACGLVIALRFRDDWHREYRELWLDREKN